MNNTDANYPLTYVITYKPEHSQLIQPNINCKIKERKTKWFKFLSLHNLSFVPIALHYNLNSFTITCTIYFYDFKAWVNKLIFQSIFPFNMADIQLAWGKILIEFASSSHQLPGREDEIWTTRVLRMLHLNLARRLSSDPKSDYLSDPTYEHAHTP